MSSSINWSQVYNTPIGQILQDLSPNTFAQLATQENNLQISNYQKQEQTDQTDISAWSTLQSDAQTFGGDLANLSQSSTYSQLQSSSSDSNVATAIDQSAQQGSYTISVNSVAQAEIDSGTTANMTVTDPNATLMVPGTTTPLQGSFSIAVGNGSAVTVNLPSGGESLNGLASLINSTAGIGVTASVVQNSSGDWLLEIQANQTGQAITYGDNGLGSTSSQPNGPLYYLGVVGTGTSGLSAADPLQAPSDATVSFGSTYNSSNAITSSSNTFTNLIPGMTVTVNAPGTTTITVSPNTSAMVSSVKQFVSDWNQWVKDTQNLAQSGQVVASGTGSSATYAYQSNPNQVLTSGLPSAVLDQVGQLLAETTSGQGGQYQSLADIGITLGTNGQMTLNSTTLSQALRSNPTAVQAIFQQLNGTIGAGGSTPGIINGFSQGATSTVGEAIGTLNQQSAQDKSQATLLQQQLNSEEQQAILKYGQWVNQVSRYSEQYSLLQALFNPQGSNNSNGG